MQICSRPNWIGRRFPSIGTRRNINLFRFVIASLIKRRPMDFGCGKKASKPPRQTLFN
jgi:hypothetical protein